MNRQLLDTWVSLRRAALSPVGHRQRLAGGLARLLLVAVTLGGLAAPASAQDFSTVLDIDFADLDFSDAVLESGTALQADAVYAYDAVYVSVEATVDATITIVAIDNSTLGAFDNATNPARFEPTINSGDGGGFVQFRVDLFDAETAEPIAITNFAVTGVDIDGGAGSQEFHSVGGFSSYIVDESTGLVITPGSPFTRFRGIMTDLTDITFDNTAAYIANYTAPVASLSFQLGNTGNPGSNRLYSVALGRPAGEFDNPIVTNAPSVVLTTTDVTPEGPFVVTVTFSEPVSGLTEGEILVTNGTVEPGSLTTSDGITYTFTVIPNAEGVITVRVPVGAAQSDETGMDNTSSNRLRVVYTESEPGDADGDGTPSDRDPDDDDPCVPSDTVPACDSDGDGLPDGIEVTTDPDDPDSDGDGLCDGPVAVEDVCEAGEDLNGNGVVDVGETDPNNPDSDGDGIDDGTETFGGGHTSPIDPDSDDDRLCDGPNDVESICTGGEDLDADGQIDVGETDPSDPDTDDGGVPDGQEVLDDFTDPLDPSDDVPDDDRDNDGLSNDDEVSLGTDPDDPDSDDDGILDGTEVNGDNPTDPNDPDSDNDGLCDGPLSVPGVCVGGEDLDGNGAIDDGETDPNNADTDGGGVNDGDEAGAGLDPLDGNDDVQESRPINFRGGGVVGCSATGSSGGWYWALVLALVGGVLTGRRRRGRATRGW